MSTPDVLGEMFLMGLSRRTQPHPVWIFNYIIMGSNVFLMPFVVTRRSRTV